jgi:hypothetical protein
MRALWQGPSRPLAWWWALLTLASIANVGLWFFLYRRFYSAPADTAGGSTGVGLMLLLCAAYVFGCAFRSVLPRADVQRICLFDTWLSSVVVGRSVATVAEVCFGTQWAIGLRQLGEMAGADTTLAVAAIIVPLIVVAQCCSWYGVLTTNYLANAIENSIWAAAFLLVGVAVCRLLPEFEGVLRLGLVAAILGIAGYLAFLIAIDVPMYLRRWREGISGGRENLGPVQGLRDASTRWVVTHDFAHWKDEIAWMSLYFTVAVWASLALCLVSCLGDNLARYRVEPSAEASSLRAAASCRDADVACTTQAGPGRKGRHHSQIMLEARAPQWSL